PEIDGDLGRVTKLVPDAQTLLKDRRGLLEPAVVPSHHRELRKRLRLEPHTARYSSGSENLPIDPSLALRIAELAGDPRDHGHGDQRVVLLAESGAPCRGLFEARSRCRQFAAF